MFVETDSGELVTPDPTPSKAFDGRWHPAAAEGDVSFGSLASQTNLGYLELADGKTVSWVLAGARPVLGQRDGDNVVYENVLPGVDLQLMTLATGVKETLVLRDRNAPAVYDFPLTLTGLTSILDDPYGPVRLVDPGTNELIGVIPMAYAVDQSPNAEGGSPEPVAAAYELVPAAGGQTILRVRLDETWLRDPARVFPVKVDPSTQSPQAEASRYITSGSPAYNSSSEHILRTGGGGGNYRSYFAKWNVGLLAGQTIVDAIYKSFNHYSYSCQARWFGLYRIADPWDPATISWNNQPNYNHALLAAHNIANGYDDNACPDAWVDSPMRDVVQDWVDGDYPNNGLTGRVSEWDDYSDPYTYKEFTRDTLGGQTLEIIHTPYRVGYGLGQWQAPTNNQAGWMDILVTNKSFLNWNAGGDNPFRLSYHVYYSDGVTLAPWGWDGARTVLPRDVNWQNGNSIWLNAPVNPLPPGDWVVKWDMVQEGVTWFSQQAVHPDLDPMAVGIHVPNVPPNIDSMEPGGQADTRTPTLKVTASNPDNWPANATLQYRFEICEDTAMTVGCVWSGDWSTSNQWSPTHLQWAKTYYWNAWVWEGCFCTQVQPLQQVALTPTVPQPVLERHFGTDPYAPLHGGVNPSVGNYVASFTDVQVASAGLPAELTRTYNSMDNRVGAFGPGWSTFLDLSATLEPTGRLLVSFPDGRKERYARNADNTWVGGPGNQSILKDRPSGAGWELRRPDQMVFVFDNQGRAAEIRDGWGHAIFLNRDGNGRITTITTDPSGVGQGAAGRSLMLTWAANGPGGAYVVTKVQTDQVTVEGQNRRPEWTYSYTSGRLTGVCLPQAAPNCMGYAYYSSGTGATGKLRTITKPGGNVPVELAYQTNGTVQWVENGVDKRWTFNDADDTAEGTYHPLDGWIAGSTTLGANATTTMDVTGGGAGQVPASGVQAVVVDLSANRPNAGGWVEVYPSGTTPTGAVSTMDYQAGDPRSVLHTVAVGEDGQIAVTNHGSASVDLRFDVVGWYAQAGVSGGSVFVPLPTKRILDTQASGGGGPIGTGPPRAVQITGQGGVPTSGVTAVVYDVESIN
ncbi:MAG TPA: DNRLRE domain-containing protein, partial [Acidimicrobiales bacterium]